MKERYLYPALMSEDQDGVAVEFPDLPGCFTCAGTLDEAYDMAREALGLHLYGLESEGATIPYPSAPRTLMSGLRGDQSVMIIEVWMPPVRGGVENKSVKKTLTIPKWLNELAERRKVNFSQVLQDSLKAYLGIGERPRGASPAEREMTAGLEGELLDLPPSVLHEEGGEWAAVAESVTTVARARNDYSERVLPYSEGGAPSQELRPAPISAADLVKYRRGQRRP